MAKTTWTFGTILKQKKRDNYQKFLLRIPKLLNKKLSELNLQRQDLLNKQNGVPLTDSESRLYNSLIKKTNDVKFMDSMSEDEEIDLFSELSVLERKKSGEALDITEQDTLELTESSMKKLIQIKKELPNYLEFKYEFLSKLSTFALFRYASLLTDIVANPSEAEISWAQVVDQDPHEERDIVMLFDPTAKNSPYFNPLYGSEEIAVGTVTSTLMASMSDSGDYFKNLSKTVIQNAIHVVKRVKGNDATLLHVNDILTNNGNRGEQMVKELLALDTTSEKVLENRDFAAFFTNEYYTGLKGDRNAGKTYENSSGIRNIMTNLLDNSRLRKVLNPPPGVGSDIDFDLILRTGDKVALSTATGVSDDIGRMLGSFLILQLQAAIFRRRGTESTRTPVIMYIDEFQDYASESFQDVLTKGRSYAVSATMATQTLGIVESNAGSGLVENLQSNARNVIVYPGSSAQDAQYFVSLFGKEEMKTTQRSLNQEVEKEQTIADKIKSSIPVGDEGGSGGGQRESVSEVIDSVDRFTQTQVIYGPNVDTRGPSFGFVYFRAIVKNSVQIPSVAKIEYIPYELKKESDKLLQAYDAVNKLSPNDDVTHNTSDITPEDKTVDPIGANEMDAIPPTIAELSKDTDKEQFDPTVLTRGIGDLAATETELNDLPDITDVIDVPDIPEMPEIPSLDDIQTESVGTGTDDFGTNLDIEKVEENKDPFAGINLTDFGSFDL